MNYEKQISDLSKAIFGLNQSVEALRKNTESRNNFEQFAYGQGVSKFDDRLSTSYPRCEIVNVTAPAWQNDATGHINPGFVIARSSINVKRIQVSTVVTGTFNSGHRLGIQLSNDEKTFREIYPGLLASQIFCFSVPVWRNFGVSPYFGMDRPIIIDTNLSRIAIGTFTFTDKVETTNDRVGNFYKPVFSIMFEGF